MIRSLSATNFRRHADLCLRFDDDRQLILIAGANGVGKSTILEAITFALWGESRHGRRNLDALVRRGAELEGMSVELVFTVGADEFRVHRRRDGKAVTAVLYANDLPVVEGPVAVSAEIAALLGMDAAGFRLAVIAQQKDLDGLASLRPAERAAMVTRLLRLDALSAAKAEAGTRFRTERDIAAGLRSGADMGDLVAARTAADADHVAATGELTAAETALSRLDAELTASADVDGRWDAAQTAVARLEGAVGQLERRRADVETELAALTIPEVAGSAADVAALAAAVADVERRIARGEEVARTVRTRDVVTAELDGVVARIREIDRRLAELADLDVDTATAELDALLADVERADTAVTELRGELAALAERRTAAEGRLAAAGALGADCDACGQPISDTHRHVQQDRLAAELAAVDERIGTVRATGSERFDRLTALRAEVDVARVRVDQVRADRAEKGRLESERVELDRRRRTYQGQIDRFDVEPVDLDALLVRRAELAADVAAASAHAEQVRRRDAALARHSELHAALAEVTGLLADQHEQLTVARPDAALTAAYQARLDMLARRNVEADLVAHWRVEVARAAVARDAAAAAVDAAAAVEERRALHQERAVSAAAAARLLGDVAERLAVAIRPALEGTVAALLSTMSEGRFSAVRISDEYAITVEDDGRFRPLSELSGGEVDLVALAVRLALAQVVADRHGAGGAGFLILDECFASQDAARRQAILAALRTLRDVYSQIFLISHVENIEDSADLVVSVRTGADRADTEVIVS